jgi:RNA polymerase sigma factor (sigma-70 family)
VAFYFNREEVITMSWLYEHRLQLDGLRPLIVIAHWAVISHVPPDDQDDMEQEIVISLMQAVDKYGNENKNYLYTVARNQIWKFLRKKYRDKRRLTYILLSDKGEVARGTWLSVHDGDTDARLDAMATLTALPERLIQIGYKIENDETLSEADQSYWRRQKAKLRPKLDCRRYANRLSDWEKRRILRLHSDGVSMSRTARVIGRTNRAVMRVLAGVPPPPPKMTAEQKDNGIRYAHFVEGKNTSQIARELHYGRGTVRRALNKSKLEAVASV